jgi:8-oxo-dGTP pyrophosphatase MutT (NUDIX family)
MTNAHSGESPPSSAPHQNDDEAGLVPAHAAATLVIFHEHADFAQPKILMVRRSAAMKFAAGAAVFPGGRVDDDDHVVAEALIADRASPHAALDLEDAAARVAAIRETLEETGLPIGIHHGDPVQAGDMVGQAQRLHAMRAGLLAESRFSALLADAGAALDLMALAPFARWRPNFAHARVFDTRFYITRVAGDLPPLSTVEQENSGLFWDHAAGTLAAADAGDVNVIFPTRRNLERLAQYADFDAAHRSTILHPSRRITPTIEERDDGKYLCIPDDCGYPVTRERIDTAMRG